MPRLTRLDERRVERLAAAEERRQVFSGQLQGWKEKAVEIL